MEKIIMKKEKKEKEKEKKKKKMEIRGLLVAALIVFGIWILPKNVSPHTVNCCNGSFWLQLESGFWSWVNTQCSNIFNDIIMRKALPFKLSELLSEKMLIKHTTRANLIFKILFRG